MPVVIVLAAAVILAGIVVVAMGRGGELARDRADRATELDFRTWSDVAEYRPPAALIGYHAAATEQALALIARTIAEREAEINWLRRQLAEFQPEHSGASAMRTDLAGPDPVDAAATDLGAAAADEPGRPAEAVWRAAGEAEPGAPVTTGYSAGQRGEDE